MAKQEQTTQPLATTKPANEVRRQRDPELLAMERVCKIMEGLDQRAQSRLLIWLAGRMNCTLMFHTEECSANNQQGASPDLPFKSV